jgi:hypothetical protein
MPLVRQHPARQHVPAAASAVHAYRRPCRVTRPIFDFIHSLYIPSGDSDASSFRERFALMGLICVLLFEVPLLCLL